ncbi:PTS sugar transporter subunit IIA [Candidatus Fermentibacteria bacterium]|nr:PTS sugar transporter subunit IIA [Candidatus Fermentibacteria bacterium]
MEIMDALAPERVKILSSRTKQDALRELIRLLADSGTISDSQELERLIMEREALMSTGIGLGIAVPHARLPEVQVSVIAFGTVREGIPDYESIDGSSVRIVCMIITGTQRQREYIELLSSLARVFKDESARERVLQARTSSELWAALRHEISGTLS